MVRAPLAAKVDGSHTLIDTWIHLAGGRNAAAQRIMLAAGVMVIYFKSVGHPAKKPAYPVDILHIGEIFCCGSPMGRGIKNLKPLTI